MEKRKEKDTELLQSELKRAVNLESFLKENDSILMEFTKDMLLYDIKQ